MCQKKKTPTAKRPKKISDLGNHMLEINGEHELTQDTMDENSFGVLGDG